MSDPIAIYSVVPCYKNYKPMNLQHTVFPAVSYTHLFSSAPSKLVCPELPNFLVLFFLNLTLETSFSTSRTLFPSLGNTSSAILTFLQPIPSHSQLFYLLYFCFPFLYALLFYVHRNLLSNAATTLTISTLLLSSNLAPHHHVLLLFHI